MSVISKELSDNRLRMEQVFSQCKDFVILPWTYGYKHSQSAFSVYLDTITTDNEINYMKKTLQDLVTHELGEGTEVQAEEVVAFFEHQGVSTQKGLLLADFAQAVEGIVNGNVVIFFDGWDKAVSYEAISIESRQVSEPLTESVVQGPHEGTVESLKKNLGLLRSRLRNPNFKLESIICGGNTKTEIVYGYLEGIVKPELLAEFKKRISNMDKAEILETAFVEELIEDSNYSPFPQYRYTERPDTAVASLIEGKIIVLSQGSSTIMICPGLFAEFFQSSEDYYQRAVIASMLRLLRIAAFFIALLLPGIYVSLLTHHPELIPTVLLMAIIDSREGIPFPTFVEALIMQFFFELLREAGVRLPKPVGSAVSIVGALVIGDAAIKAGIASPIMVVIVALTGIASFALPQFVMGIPLRLMQIPLMLLANSLGIFGMMIGLLWITLHLTALRSLGEPYFKPFAPLRPKPLLDVIIRAPIKFVIQSPRKKGTR